MYSSGKKKNLHTLPDPHLIPMMVYVLLLFLFLYISYSKQVVFFKKSGIPDLFFYGDLMVKINRSTDLKENRW